MHRFRGAEGGVGVVELPIIYCIRISVVHGKCVNEQRTELEARV